MNILLMQTGVETAAKFVGYATSLLTLIALVAGFAWYVFKGKDETQIKQERDEWKGLAEVKQARIMQLETDLKLINQQAVTHKLRAAALEQELTGLTRLLARLQGQHNP